MVCSGESAAQAIPEWPVAAHMPSVRIRILNRKRRQCYSMYFRNDSYKNAGGGIKVRSGGGHFRAGVKEKDRFYARSFQRRPCFSICWLGTSPRRWRRMYSFARTRSGSTRSRTARKSSKRGYSLRKSAGVRVWVLAQCGRPEKRLKRVEEKRAK